MLHINSETFFLGREISEWLRQSFCAAFQMEAPLFKDVVAVPTVNPEFGDYQ